MNLRLQRVERRRSNRQARWTLLRCGAATGAGTFMALERCSGRSIRLSAHSSASAQAQVELLNRHSIELRA